jgi:hypothetical protein
MRERELPDVRVLADKVKMLAGMEVLLDKEQLGPAVLLVK